jgi:hypothetical protein
MRSLKDGNLNPLSPGHYPSELIRDLPEKHLCWWFSLCHHPNTPQLSPTISTRKSITYPVQLKTSVTHLLLLSSWVTTLNLFLEVKSSSRVEQSRPVPWTGLYSSMRCLGLTFAGATIEGQQPLTAGISY